MEQYELEHRVLEILVKQVIDHVKQKSFGEEYRDKISDEKVLGVALAHYFKWDGNAIFDVAESGFEDSNFHSFNEKFEKLWSDEV